MFTQHIREPRHLLVDLALKNAAHVIEVFFGSPLFRLIGIGLPPTVGVNSVTSATAQTAIGSCRCKVGYTGPDGGPCTGCALSTYKGTTGSALCTACPANAVTLATGQTVLSQCVCNSGHTGVNGGTCNACEAGSYKGTTGSQPCTLCAENTYSTTVAAVSADCTACPVNSISGAGSGSIVQCYCIAGYNQTTTHDSCVECLPGYYDN